MRSAHRTHLVPTLSECPHCADQLPCLISNSPVYFAEQIQLAGAGVQDGSANAARATGRTEATPGPGRTEPRPGGAAVQGAAHGQWWPSLLVI